MSRPIEATTRLRTSLERARELLLRDPASVLGMEGGQGRAPRTFIAELSVPAGRGGTVREQVEIEILAVRLDDHAARWELAWKAVGRARMFPTFSGTLSVEDGPRTVLRLSGAYEPPLGAAGRFGDGLIGHRIARRSLEDFVERVAARIDRAVDRRAG